MNVSDAVSARKSTRSFLPDPVEDQVLRTLLEKASRAPSGGNVQPWRVLVLNGESMARFREHMDGREFEAPGYEIYPANLQEPYRTNRFSVGEQMYATMGIGRDDKAGRHAHLARNSDFFGAASAIFCYIDRAMGKPQWSDLGMFLQTFMLLAAEAGLDTCPQEFWTMHHAAVAEFVDAPEEWILFSAVAVGTADPDAPVNSLVAERQPLDEWATFL